MNVEKEPPTTQLGGGKKRVRRRGSGMFAMMSLSPAH